MFICFLFCPLLTKSSSYKELMCFPLLGTAMVLWHWEHKPLVKGWHPLYLNFMRKYLTTSSWSARSWNSSFSHSILELNFNYQVFRKYRSSWVRIWAILTHFLWKTVQWPAEGKHGAWPFSSQLFLTMPSRWLTHSQGAYTRTCSSLTTHPQQSLGIKFPVHEV